MSEKKDFWANLFSGGCSCGMSVEEEKADDQKPAKKKGRCCDMEIIEKSSCCGADTDKK